MFYEVWAFSPKPHFTCFGLNLALISDKTLTKNGLSVSDTFFRHCVRKRRFLKGIRDFSDTSVPEVNLGLGCWAYSNSDKIPNRAKSLCFDIVNASYKNDN